MVRSKFREKRGEDVRTLLGVVWCGVVRYGIVRFYMTRELFLNARSCGHALRLNTIHQWMKSLGLGLDPGLDPGPVQIDRQTDSPYSPAACSGCMNVQARQGKARAGQGDCIHLSSLGVFQSDFFRPVSLSFEASLL